MRKRGAGLRRLVGRCRIGRWRLPGPRDGPQGPARRPWRVRPFHIASHRPAPPRPREFGPRQGQDRGALRFAAGGAPARLPAGPGGTAGVAIAIGMERSFSGLGVPRGGFEAAGETRIDPAAASRSARPPAPERDRPVSRGAAPPSARPPRTASSPRRSPDQTPSRLRHHPRWRYGPWCDGCWTRGLGGCASRARGPVADVGLPEARFGRSDIGRNPEVARPSELVHLDHLDAELAREVAHDGRADGAGAAGDEGALHWKPSEVRTPGRPASRGWRASSGHSSAAAGATGQAMPSAGSSEAMTPSGPTVH